MKKAIIHCLVALCAISTNIHALEPPAGLDKAETKVIESSQKSQENLDAAASKTPDAASKGIAKSREKARLGQSKALQGISRGRSAFDIHAGGKRSGTGAKGKGRR